MTKLYTIGHSTLTLEQFLEILHNYQIKHVVDVRTIPKSSHVPHFNKEVLKKILPTEKIHYSHLPELGGLRHPKKDSINDAWVNKGFRGFADYMQTREFFQALKKLKGFLKDHYTAIMCAEALPWRCHRSLIADAEVVRGINVLHIMSKTSTHAHELTQFAIVDRNKKPIKIYYPKEKQGRLFS